MDPLEVEILKFIAAHYPQHAAVLESQIRNCAVSGREFTGGGGVFTSLTPSDQCQPLPIDTMGEGASFEGPALTSPELESGASTLLHFSSDGYIDSLEIWANAGDYPPDRHATDVTLSPFDSNVIDLR